MVDYYSTHHYFIGYDAKVESIYSVWNLFDDSIIRERNVIFDETLYFQGEAGLGLGVKKLLVAIL